jgi:hypothetical protein
MHKGKIQIWTDDLRVNIEVAVTMLEEPKRQAHNRHVSEEEPLKAPSLA